MRWMSTAGSTRETCYSDLLRAVGQFLDADAPESVEIADEGATLTLNWVDRDGNPQARTFDKKHDLDKMRQEGRGRRGTPAEQSNGEREELLRTLGEELDMTGANLVRIKEIHGYKVIVVDDAERIELWYSRDELLEKSRARRDQRRVAPFGTRSAWWRFRQRAPAA